MSKIRNYSEEDTKAKFIDPILQNTFGENDIRREYQITDGEIIGVDGSNKPIRKKSLRADYVLSINGVSIAIVEAKKYALEIGDGLPQAKNYAKQMNLPFAFSTNGKGFRFYNDFTKETKDFPMDKFPTKEELIDLYFTYNSLPLKEKNNVLNPLYFASGYEKKARYYQQIAIQKTVEAIIKGKKRLLLVMATGCGKTFSAFQITHRLMNLKDGLGNKTIKRVLFLADRNMLIDQTMSNDFNPLNKVSNKIKLNGEDLSKAYNVYFSIYQQLSLDSNVEICEEDNEDSLRNLKSKFKADEFDLIIVDECHRGGVQENSSWRKILEYFSPAIQIGLTATPKEKHSEKDKFTATSDYFTDLVYTYSYANGVKDGFLAPYNVLSINTNVDKYGVFNGNEAYSNKAIDKKIIIDERTMIVAKRVTEYLRATDPYQKTIVFCADTEHADRMRNALIECNKDLVSKHNDYVVRITSKENQEEKKLLLDSFMDSTTLTPTIATTSKLLTTGADTKPCKVIVLDSNINSISEFKQIVGRGSRIDEVSNKSIFTIIDFKGICEKFRDDSFDGSPLATVTINENDDITNAIRNIQEKHEENLLKNADELLNHEKKIVSTPVIVLDENMRYLNDGGQDITDVLKNELKERFLEEYASLDIFKEEFLEKAQNPNDYERFLDNITNNYNINDFISADKIKEIDVYDKIMHVIFEKPLLSRSERALKLISSGFLDKYNEDQKIILELYLEEYEAGIAYNISNPNNFKTVNSLNDLIGLLKANKLFDKKLRIDLIDLYEKLYSI